MTVPSAVEVIEDIASKLPWGTKDDGACAKWLLDALSAAGYVVVNPQDEESMRAAGFVPGLSMPPLDCTNSCMEGPCDCSGVNRVVAWKWLAPEPSEP